MINSILKLDTQKIKPMPVHGGMAAILRDGEKKTNQHRIFQGTFLLHPNKTGYNDHRMLTDL